MNADMGFLVVGTAISACAIGVSLWGYLRSDWRVEPDPERLRRFIESAPMDRLKPVGGGEPELPQGESAGEVSDDRGQDTRGSRRLVFRLFGSISVEIGCRPEKAPTGCRRCQRQPPDTGG
ncbi:hypothetical protein [Sagittula salina]|uniref:Uncharacterized protein n=1 Tax=Sagittula salina TaxID=2820268 RepID=A0A940MKS0_9RHOB|nr:hypothetical protein [Sagittula salina]MBP0483625.1 hypothetical protein [Sagittula salina]